MQLEDGRFLMSASRYDSLLKVNKHKVFDNRNKENQVLHEKVENDQNRILDYTKGPWNNNI